jgi:hypothetical protein
MEVNQTGPEGPASAAPANPDSPAQTDGAGVSTPEQAVSSKHTGAPAWVLPIYLVGLVMVFVAERVISTHETARWATGLAGLAAVVGATVLRFVMLPPSRGDRRGIELLLGALSAAGLVALGLYYATTAPLDGWLGLTTGDVSARENHRALLTVAWVVLLTMTVLPMVLAEAALFPMRRALRPEGRRVRAAAASGVVIAEALAYSALIVYAVSTLDIKVDYSYFKTSEPGESTLRIARSLDQPVTVYAFFPQVNEVKNEVAGYLKGLAAKAPKLKVEFKDRLLVPELARKLRAGRDGTLILSRDETTESLQIGTELADARSTLKTLDKSFQKLLLKVARSARTVYLTVGHGELNDSSGLAVNPERAVSILRQLVESQNYRIKDLGLAQGLASEIPDDATAVMVLGPTQPFAPEEIGALKRYLDRNGHLLLALDPGSLLPAGVADVDAAGKSSDRAEARMPGGDDAKSPGGKGKKAHPETKPGSASAEAPAPALAGMTAGLEALAGLVGLRLVADPLANDQQHLARRFNKSDRTQLFTNRFSSHASVSTLSRNSTRAAIVYFSAGSLESAGGQLATDFAVKTMPNTYRDANRDYEHEEGEPSGVFNIAAAVSKASAASKPSVKDAKNAKGADEMRAFVTADADMFGDLIMSRAMTNQLFLVDVLRWLGGEESFAGEINSEEDVRIEHTRDKDVVWFYATIFGAPALVLGLGLVVARRSRRPKGGQR